MLIKIAFVYIIIGCLFSLLYIWRKKEDRLHVTLAVITGWPIFLFSMIGAGWNALLNQERGDPPL